MTRALTIRKNKYYDGWRVLYTSEGGNVNPKGDPAVLPSDAQDGIWFTRPMQELSWALMDTYNDVVTKSKWRIVYENDTGFTNTQGFNKPNDPRADWVNLKNIDKPLPKLMKRIVCSGSFVKGNAVGDRLWVYPGVGAIDANNIPDLKTVVENHWYFYATIYDNNPSNFPQGADASIEYYGDILIPYILDKPTSYPLNCFQKWQGNTLPDHLRIYL